MLIRVFQIIRKSQVLEVPFSLLMNVHQYSLVFGDEILAQGLHLKSHQRCSAEIRTCLSADQSSSSTLTESSFLFDPCLIHRDTAMLE